MQHRSIKPHSETLLATAPKQAALIAVSAPEASSESLGLYQGLVFVGHLLIHSFICFEVWLGANYDQQNGVGGAGF